MDNLSAAERLEQFESSQLLQQVKDLQQELKDQQKAHTDELSAVMKREGIITDPVAHVIDMLQRFSGMETQTQELQSMMLTQRDEIANQAEYITQLEETLQVAQQSAKTLRTEYDKLDITCKDMHRAADSARVVLEDRNTQIKALKAMNPERLNKKNKELTKKNAELNEANSLLTKNNRELKAAGREKDQALIKMSDQKKTIEKGFTDLQRGIKEGTATSCAAKIGDWEIHQDTEVCDRLHILDTTVGSVRVWQKGAFLKSRNVPQEVKDKALVVADRQQRIATGLDFTYGQE